MILTSWQTVYVAISRGKKPDLFASTHRKEKIRRRIIIINHSTLFMDLDTYSAHLAGTQNNIAHLLYYYDTSEKKQKSPVSCNTIESYHNNCHLLIVYTRHGAPLFLSR